MRLAPYNEAGPLQSLRHRQDGVTQPAMGRMAPQSPVPKHHHWYTRRVIWRLAQNQRMAAHELQRDPAAQCRHHVGLDKNWRRGEIRGPQRDVACKLLLREPPVDEAGILAARRDL